MGNEAGKEDIKVKIQKAAILVIGLTLALFHIYTSFFGALPSYQHRIIHLVMSMMLVPLCYDLFKCKSNTGKMIYQVIFIGILAAIGIYSYSIANDMWKQSGTMSNIDMVLGTLLILMLLYFTWRVVGAAMPIIAILCILYALLGPKLPQGIAHRGYNWSRITELLFKGTNGIFGTPLGVSSIYVSVFVIFAGVLEASGAGDVFIRLTQSLLGGFRGGPAKVAVVASSLFGTISGSAVANVVGTGSFTIPLMKKSGFKPEFAGAVETAASSGGQLMPPVMGAAAFIMADYIGSYQQVLVAAIIPAILFYIALFMMIDLEALKNNLRGQSKEELPNFKEELKNGWFLLLPLVLLVFLLVGVRYSAQKSAFFSIIFLVLIMLLYPGKRRKFWDVVKLIAGSSKGMVSVALTTGTAGIIVGILMLTGIGYKLSSLLIALSGGHVFLLLFLTMLTSVILGMGMPTSAAYVLLATLIVPALEELGVMKIAAHFFVFYFGIMANVTPPVAVAAYTAAGIAKADSMKTGLVAWRLSLAGFLMPFMFCINPALIGQGTMVEIILAIATALIGSYGLATAVQRYFKGNLNWFQTIVVLAGSIFMMVPGTMTDAIGIICIGFVYSVQIGKEKKAKASVTTQML
ncbi:TRAP transporter fused permease subunit [Clostridium sp. MCC353]|uniref:TRAP transporter permease n=1 Tax=Clostridium sp. MCC353 TaxID=2592646 RepID=UPI001C026FB9|nr:TRAP transporter permease [Clostridium sp. MCC353]MBT9778053.1 TRAP transporter fused permease subunit [Clostridium sp. MCC353]